MATVRVNCPTCNAELEIDDRHLGQEVECGSCLQTFVAEEGKKPPRPRRRDDEDEEERKPRRRRSRRDDDDDYDYSPPARGSGGDANALAVISLVFGILSFPLLCCCYLNIPASLAGIVCGAIGMQKQQGKGMAIAGLILSIVSLLLFGGLVILGFGANMMNMNQFNRGR